MSQKKRKRTPARVLAEKRYAKTRIGKPRLPGYVLSEEENLNCNKVFSLFGKTKKEAILAGLHLLYEKLKTKDK